MNVISKIILIALVGASALANSYDSVFAQNQPQDKGKYRDKVKDRIKKIRTNNNLDDDEVTEINANLSTLSDEHVRKISEICDAKKIGDTNVPLDKKRKDKKNAYKIALRKLNKSQKEAAIDQIHATFIQTGQITADQGLSIVNSTAKQNPVVAMLTWLAMRFL